MGVVFNINNVKIRLQIFESKKLPGPRLKSSHDFCEIVKPGSNQNMHLNICNLIRVQTHNKFHSVGNELQILKAYVKFFSIAATISTTSWRLDCTNTSRFSPSIDNSTTVLIAWDISVLSFLKKKNILYETLIDKLLMFIEERIDRDWNWKQLYQL